MLEETAKVKKPLWSPSQDCHSQARLLCELEMLTVSFAGKALWSQLPAVLPQKRVASSLAEPESCLIETSISFMLHPCSQTVDFLPMTAKTSVFEGNRRSKENGSSFKKQSSKYRIPFSLAREVFTFKARGKTFRKHNKATKQVHNQKLSSPQQ